MKLNIRGIDPFFLPILVIIFIFMGEKYPQVSGNVSQNIRGLRVPEPHQMGANIYIYIIACITL